MIQAEPNATKNLESLSSIKVRNGNEMAPITQFVSIKKVYGPDIISRFNLYTSMKVMVAPASGYTSVRHWLPLQRLPKKAFRQVSPTNLEVWPAKRLKPAAALPV